MIYGLVFLLGLGFDLFKLNLLGQTSLIWLVLTFLAAIFLQNWRVYLKEKRLSRQSS